MGVGALSRTAFAALVREHHAAVYGAAFRLVRNDADALDVTQKVFLRVLEGKVDLSRAEEKGRVLAFLSVKTALQHLRGDRNRRRHEAGRVDVMRENDSDAEREIPKYVDGLPDDLRVPVVLRFHEGMTFARIAEVLECSEPTAHDRVRRGLERLRFDLAKAGFASALLAGAGLEDALARPPAPPTVPAGVEGSLLALSASTWGIAALWPAAAVVALLVGAGGGYLALRGDDGAAPSAGGDGEPAALVALAAGNGGDGGGSGASEPGQRRLEANPPAVPARAGSPDAQVESPSPVDRPAALGTIEGRVLSEAGAGVAGADVRAESAERSGKLPRHAVAAKTDESGGFRIAVPASLAEGEIYTLLVMHPNFVFRRSDRVTVRPGEVATIEPLTVAASASDVPGEYAIEIVVTDDAAGPVAGAGVSLHRRVKSAAGGLVPEWEAGGATDAEGRVRLAGARLGDKWLRVDARAKGLRLHEEALSIDEPGDHHAHEVTLAPGLAIAGRLGVDGDANGGPPAGARLVARSEEEPAHDWEHAEIDAASGEFRFVGLAPGRYRLDAFADGFSAFRLEGVEAGTNGIEIALKRADDDSDTGDHLAEIHGTVRDARTGKLLSVGWDAVDVERLPEETSDEELRRDVFPTLLAAVPRQVAFAFGSGPPAPSAEFHSTGLDAGTYAVVARVAGYAPAIAGPIRLEEGGIAKDVELRLDRGAAVAGTVTGPDGSPVAGAFVFLTGDGERSGARIAQFDDAVRESGGRGTVMIWGEVRTDAAGGFVFDHAPADLALRVAAVHPKFAPASADAAPAGARVTLRLAER